MWQKNGPIYTNQKLEIKRRNNLSDKRVFEMTNFQKKRREPFLDQASYQWLQKHTIETSLPKFREKLNDPTTDAERRGSMKWQISLDMIAYAIRSYSGGENLERVKISLKETLDVIEEHLDDDHTLMEAFDFAIQDSYVQALWLLSLTKLLGLGSEQVKRVAEFYEADETNEGADDLYELILDKLGLPSKLDDAGVIHEDPYELLLDCVKAEPEDRPKHMTGFLKRWFKGQKECDWWGSHINRRGTPVLDTDFFGYWAFEAALVTYLWDIDDSSYSNLPHYPKDLIDYAREHFPLNGEPKPPTLSCPAGEPCPREGYWHTPAQTGSRRYFKQGEIMPKLQSDWGSVIWYWDESQT